MASRGSSDEGEIRDGHSVVEKATKTLPHINGTSVDRPDRTRSISSASKSPEHAYPSRDPRSRDRSRSPYSARGAKRPRDDDYPDRSRDTRRFKVHYEDDPRDYARRSRISYDDIDQGPCSSDRRYDDRDRYSQKRHRTRSRSPYRADRSGDRDRGNDRNGGRGQRGRDGSYYNGYADGGRPNSYGRGDARGRGAQDQSVNKRGPSPLPAENAKQEAKHAEGSSQQHNATSDANKESKK